MSPRSRAKTRILYVTDGFAPAVIGGMQSYARRQLETLAEAGFDLVSISPVEPGEPLPWRNIVLPWPRRTLLSKLNPWRYVADLKAFSAKVSEIADELSPDLIYSEGPLLHHYLHRTDRPARTLFNPHGLEMFQRKGSLTEDLKSWPLRGIVADHARRADVTICLSEQGQLQRILRDHIGIAPVRIAVLPNAAPSAESAPHAAPSGTGKFLFVGRDEPRKALPLLIEAFAGISGAELDLVGIDEVPGGAQARVRAHGSVRDRARIRQFYAAADFLVAPSHAEGMPTVILEAFAAGLPVIATDVGANADLVRDGETGFLVPRADRRALQEAMRKAIRIGAADHAALSGRCLALARGRYSADAARDRLLALLDAQGKVDKRDDA